LSLRWIHENPPRWDEGKARVIGGAAAGSIRLATYRIGELIPGEWWRVEREDEIVGYGWMDTTWGDAEVLLAVDPASRQRGVGSFILDRLEHEAAARGLHYMVNVVPAAHPDRAGFSRWLEQRRFEPAPGDRHRRRVIHPPRR